jgi:hypothetical protein
MKAFVLTTALLFGCCAPALAQTRPSSSSSATRPVEADVRTFELTPVAPPQPAMKYQLLFDDLDQRRPGNAAVIYLEASIMLGEGTPEEAYKALEAYEAGDRKTFDALAESISKRPALIQLMDVAARRQECDWQPSIREMGVRTLLPHLTRLFALAKVLRVHALRQIDQGKTEDALATLRLNYELSYKMAHEPVIVSNMVAIGTLGRNEALAALMNRPESPNLYWALSDLPARRPILRWAFDSGRLGSTTSTVPLLARAKAGEALTNEQWRAVLEAVTELVPPDAHGQPREVHFPDPVRDASPEILRRAQAHYAQVNHTSAEQAAKVDPTILLGAFYFHEYEIAYDEMYKLRTLPYPAMLAMSQAYTARAAKWRSEQPANPFMQCLPDIHRIYWNFAKADRQIAALTGVEALRSYAAANGGILPKRLEDVTETPVPENPATGRPFEYRVENGAATLSDSKSEEPLRYTIGIRKAP